MKDWVKRLRAAVLKPHKRVQEHIIYPYDHCPEVECSSCIFINECNYVKPEGDS